MEKASKIWMDGKFVPWDKANVHILTHTLHYGGGAFEGIRFYKTKQGPAIFRLKEHINRLFYSAGTIGMKIPFTRPQLNNAIKELIILNKLQEGYIRPLVYYGYGKMGLDPRGCVVNVAIAAWQWGAYLGEKPVTTKTSRFMRIHPKSTNTEAKICGHYANSILASLDVHGQGYGEAILLDHKGNVAEGPGENIFFVKNNELITPKRGNILAGITRESIIEIAKKKGVRVKEKTVKLQEILKADEAFFTGTAAEVSPISHINNKKIGKKSVGPITAILKETFTTIIHGEDPEYKKWLTIANK